VQFARCRSWRQMSVWESWTSFVTTAIYLGELTGSRPGRFTSGKRTCGACWMGDCCGLQSRPGCLGAEKRRVPAGIQTPYHPTYSLVIILTTPFRLLECNATRMKTCNFCYGLFHLHLRKQMLYSYLLDSANIFYTIIWPVINCTYAKSV
jgi:hypothetical protein